MTLPSIVAIYAPAPQSGKSTIAKYLVGSKQYVTLAFADPIKEWLVHFLVMYGYTTEQARDYFWKNKTTPLTKVPGQPTPRHLMQTLGTEWGRNLISPRLWTELWVIKAAEALSRDQKIVVDDLRFLSEWEATKDPRVLTHQKDSQTWYISRLEVLNAAVCNGDLDHASEGNFHKDLSVFDAFFENEGTIPELLKQVENHLAEPND